jgi:hypothetical protein
MALPHTTITPIPDSQPDAVPSLWNTRYEEIDENFANHEIRISSCESEISNARGGKSNLDARLDELEGNIQGLDPEFQNNFVAALLQAIDMAGLANREIERFKRVRIQEGETTIYNRGIISGCTITRKAANTRILSISVGKIFMHGRSWEVAADIDATTVPPNPGASSATCYVYLYSDINNIIQCQCTPINVAAPADGLTIYTITVPAGSIGDSDLFTITDARRICSNWPNVFTSPAYNAVALAYVLSDANYGVHLDIVSCEGGRQQIGALEIEDRLNNGFKIYLAGAADAVRVRYHVQRMI